MTGGTTVIDELPEAVAVPRSNGELTFAEPWEGRVLGLALALHEQGRFNWDTFRNRLVAAIAAGDEQPYYVSWLAALGEVAVDGGLVDAGELEDRTREYLNGVRSEVY